MRSLRALFAGILTVAAFGGSAAYAQEDSGRYWVNPAWSGTSRADEALLQRSLEAQTAQDDLTLGFTITGITGIQGQLELGRITLGPGSEGDPLQNFLYPGADMTPLDEAVGEASIRWNLTPRLSVSTSYSRDVADPTLHDGTPVFEDTLAGGVTYAITPRFAISAQGSRTEASDTNVGDVQDFTADEAEVGAAFQFLPYFTGSVNYTYQSYDGQEGVLRHDESTLSLSLTGRF